MVDLNWEGKSKNKKESFNQPPNGNISLNISEIIHPQIIHRFRNEGSLSQSIAENMRRNKGEKWINKLIQGDSLEVLHCLLQDYEGKIDLIYIDPPFFSRKKHYYKIFIGEPKRSVKKVAYTDHWEEGLDTYLEFLYERLYLMKKLLSARGSIYVHLDHHASHYVKIMLDELFGKENFRNEIIWHYPAASAQTKSFFVRSFDSILFYSKNEDYIFNDNPHLYMEYSDRVKDNLQKDEKGYFYYRGGSHDGKKLSQKVYVKRKGVFPRDVWTEIPYIRANTMEYQGFSTQKPERLLKRIILASSNEDSIIADFFCGSGTTIATAEKLGRKWIGCDVNWHAINIVKKRLLSLQNSNDILNWDQSYNESSSSFKIMYLKEKDKVKVIPSQFLRDNINRENLKSLDAPQLKLGIATDNNKVQVSIDNYIHSYDQMFGEKIQKKVKSWKDYIDLISIDFNNSNPPFCPEWIDFRTPKKRKMTFRTPWYQPEEINTLSIKVKIVDIFGIETQKKRNISL